MYKKWVLVANVTKARVFQFGREGMLELMNEWENELGRERNRVMRTGSFPRTRGRQAGSRAVFPVGFHDYQQDARLSFARTIAAELEEALEFREFDELQIYAEPGFAGVLRSRLSKAVAKKVSAWVRKDLGKINTSQIPRFLEQI